MAANQKAGGKNRKLGRHSRNPSSKLQAYRSEKNAKLRIARHLKRVKLKAESPPKIPRGTARAQRRAKLRLQFGSQA